jgi:glycerophosphoryl diester phosphodiesterase
MNRLPYILSALLLALSLAAQETPKIIAHRGYWQTDGAAQNSIRAFERAAEEGVYGSEFDVHMTADRVLVLSHDHVVQGINIHTSPYAHIADLKLSNGECIPTLREFLETARHTDTCMKLIFELKPHDTPELDREAALRSVEMIREKQLARRTEFITFSLEAGKELIRLSPDTPVHYLNGNLTPRQLKDLGFAGLDYSIDVMRKNPEWFGDAKNLRLSVNVWTVNTPALIREMADRGADFITTDVPREALMLLNDAEE